MKHRVYGLRSEWGRRTCCS